MEVEILEIFSTNPKKKYRVIGTLEISLKIKIISSDFI